MLAFISNKKQKTKNKKQNNTPHPNITFLPPSLIDL